MEIEQLHEKLQRSYLPSYTPFNHPDKAYCIRDIMEEYHEMVDYDMHFVFHVLEDCEDRIDENQAFDLF